MSLQNSGASNPLEAVLARLNTWSQSNAVKKWLSALTIVLVFAASFWLAVHPHTVQYVGRWGYVGAFFISLVASATIVLPAPGIAIIIAMSTGLNPYSLGIIAGIGSAVGEMTGYVAGRSGRAFVPEKQKRQVERLHTLTQKYGIVVLAVLAALPFPLFDFAGMVAGMLKMRVPAFLAGVSIGKSIKYIFLILLGIGPLHWLQNFFR